MTGALSAISPDFDDNLCPETPQAPSPAQIPVIEAPESSILTVDQLDGPSLASTLKLPESSSQFLSPIPPVTKPQHIFALSDLLDGSGGGLETLGPDIASADITVAPDGSFIETSSGPAARELKRRYDQLAGVGPSVRSPYAITAFVSQHGKQVYRIGHRDEHSAPAASAAEVEERMSLSKTSSEASQSPRTKRRSRLSMHFLPPAMFAKSGVPPTVRPPTASSSASSAISKKLRKTRSIPDMSSSEPVITTTPTFAVTGRGHSQSVTAMDNPRPSIPFEPYPTARQVDAFAELMDWFTPASSASSSFSTSSFFNQGSVSDSSRTRLTIQQPFGPNVTFNTPSHAEQPPLERLPAPRLLREMQSFESGLTARQEDSREDLPASDSPIPSDTSDTIHELSRPASAIRLSMLSTSIVPDEEEPVPEQTDREEKEEEETTPSSDALRLSSHYSTEVFNVLQTYRGLPMFEMLVPESQSTTIKLSLAADQSAAPRDDPRFVIWGERHPDPASEDYFSASQDSLTDLSTSNPSSSSMSVSKRRSSRVSKFKAPVASTNKLPAAPDTINRVLLAATIERWIAQLTSDLNYDELLNFFLTYRTYVSSVDLCHLLICRFHWALQQPTSKQDETVRRIVRVRTFVAIRYWLLTFFTVDFLPNRELRLLIADWLNTLIHDPVLKRHVDAVDIVRRLIKVAKECRRAHTRTNEQPKPTDLLKGPQSEEPPMNHVLGKSFAQAIRKPQDDDSDLDLDFLPDEAKTEDEASEPLTNPANAHLSAAHAVGAAGLSASRPASLPLSSLNILHRTDHAPGPSTDADIPFVPNTGPVHLATRQSALSRAFVKTIGRLGRWKRVLHPRSSSAVRATSLAACGVGASAFDIEVNAARDLLTVNGGVEQYLKLIEPPNARSIPPTNTVPQPLPSVLSPAPPVLSLATTLPTTPPPAPATGNISPPQSSESPTACQSNSGPVTTATRPGSPPFPPLPSSDELPAPVIEASSETSDIPVAPVVSLDEVNDGPEEPLTGPSTSSPRSSSDDPELLSAPDRPESFRSSSTDSFGVPLTSDGPVAPTFPGRHNPWQFDVVSIDELDYSDTSSLPAGGEDPSHPPGLRRPPRRLPFRRDFEFVRRSQVSSMGIVSHESMRDSIASSAHSESSPSSSGPPPPIHKWQMKSLQQTFELMSDDEDNGDVEAALRRLEGQINPKIEQEKAEKVDGWVRTLQERMENGDYDYESSLFSEDDVEGFIDEVDLTSTDDTDPESPSELAIPPAAEEDADNESEDAEGLPRTPVPLQTSHQLPPPPGLNPSPPRAELSKQPAVEDVVPLEILQSRMPPPEAQTAPVRPSIETVLSSKFATEVPRVHRSFVTGYSAEQLAQHFAMIDRELFMGIKFEELVTEEWLESEEINVLDWTQYLKDRARWKAESQFPNKTTALAAVRARFNLMVAFVIAEVVLTPPAERPHVVSKFIRIAWKSYNLCNFNTLTAIITALQNDWVTRAMRKPGWSRIGMFESRMFRDLKQFTTPNDDFKFMRQVVDSIADAKPLEGRHSHTPSVVSGGDSQNGKGKANSESRLPVPSACIPFIGIYLSQLHRLNKLPALIDPTAPNSLVGIDPVTANFDPPAHPEVFSALMPLPPSMRLEPLINVHKQRRIADVIKSLVAGQHLASRFQFNVDKKLFQRCLRLRGLDTALLQRALAVYSD